MPVRVTKYKCLDGALFDNEQDAEEHDNKDRIHNEVVGLFDYVNEKQFIPRTRKGIIDFICNHTVALQGIITNNKRC